jgi:hypothetical protein
MKEARQILTDMQVDVLSRENTEYGVMQVAPLGSELPFLIHINEGTLYMNSSAYVNREYPVNGVPQDMDVIKTRAGPLVAVATTTGLHLYSYSQGEISVVDTSSFPSLGASGPVNVSSLSHMDLDGDGYDEILMAVYQNSSSTHYAYRSIYVYSVDSSGTLHLSGNMSSMDIYGLPASWKIDDMMPVEHGDHIYLLAGVETIQPAAEREGTEYYRIKGALMFLRPDNSTGSWEWKELRLRGIENTSDPVSSLTA